MTDLLKYDAEVIACINGYGTYDAEGWSVDRVLDGIDYMKSLGERFRFAYTDRLLGSCCATNLAAKVSDANYLVRMDEDNILLDTYWLEMLLMPFLSDDKIGEVGPWIQHQFGYKTVVGYLYMTRRDLWNQFGGLDTVFDPGCGEDTDYSIKLQKAGYKVIGTPFNEKQFCVWHKSRGTWCWGDLGDCRSRNEQVLVSRYGPREFYGDKLKEDCDGK
jgi:hypothetical protein